MRNLKRALSLALASVMLLGMMVTGISAAGTTFADDADIANTEAVAITSGLGIFSGKGENKFDPKATVTRAEMAVVIVKMLYGADIDVKAFEGVDKFNDVKDGDWFQGWVNLCSNLGVVSGYGDGSFKPNQVVTTAEAATMIINALDLEVKGTEWPLNYIAKATEIELFGDLKLGSMAELSRDNLAVLVFEGLTYAPKATTSIEVDGVKFDSYQDAALFCILSNGQYDASDIVTVENMTGSLADKVFGMVKGTKEDAFGRVSVAYTNGKNGSQEKVFAKIAPKAELEYTKAVKVGKIVEALGFTKVADEITLTVIEDGVDGTPFTAKKTMTDAADEIGGKGVKIEVYKTGDKTYDVIVINTYVKTLAASDIVKAQAATATEDAKKAYIKVEKVGDVEWNYETDAFKKDDVILYTKNDTKIVDVVKADAVSGYVTATASGYFRVDGAKKELANVTDATYTIGTTAGVKVDAKQDYTYYCDANGYVYAIKAGKVADVETSYIYVVQAAAKGAETKAGDLFADSTSSAAAAQLKVVDLATGEIKVVDRAIVKSSGKYYYANPNGSSTGVEVVDAAVYAVGQVYAYAVQADGSYALGSSAVKTDVSVRKNVAEIATGLYANASTELKVVELELDKDSKVVGATVTTKTGIANFPSSATAYSAVVTAKDKVVSSILVVKNKAPEAAKVNYAIYKGAGETTADGTNVAFYVGGEVVEYTLAKNYAPSLTAKTVYEIELTDGKLSKATASTAKVENAKVEIVADTYVVTDKGIVYLKSDVKVYDEDASFGAGELAKDDVIDVYSSVVVNDATKGADFIVIAK